MTSSLTSQTDRLFKRATRLLVGGVNSPVRAFSHVKGTPRFFTHGKGAYLWDEEGDQYIDYVHTWGATLLGHAHPDVTQAAIYTLKKGIHFGAPHRLEADLAEHIIHAIPHLEQVRFVNSGTEACMSAVRLARGITGRNGILKFIGGYHGASDALLSDAGSGVLTEKIQRIPGIPCQTAADTYVAPYNDLEAVRHMLNEYGHTLAAIIVEPIAGNMGCIPPQAGFLEGLRALCDQYQCLLIFDEVMTGFRVHPSGAAGLFNVTPDLTLLGKVIGGGMPVAAIAGPRALLSHFAPVGQVYQAGTLSGNPVGMATGIAVMQALATMDYQHLTDYTQKLTQGMQAQAKRAGIAFSTHAIGGMFGLFFTDTSPVTHFHHVKSSNTTHFTHFFHHMLSQGIAMPPSPFEACFIGFSHNTDTLAATLDATQSTFSYLQDLAT